MALLLTTFAVVLLLMGRDNNRRITENIRLRIEQATLNEDLRQNEKGMIAIARLSDMLQSCPSRTEAYPIIAAAASNLFHETSGALALVSSGTNELKTVLQWGAGQIMLPQFSSNDCWALRLGHRYEVQGPGSGTTCQHFKSMPPGPYACLPLIVHGETTGLLHLNCANGGVLSEELHRQLLGFGDVVKLSLSNLKLRETLTAQAMRDQLTGLFNRHYLAETLPREIHRAQRNDTPLSIAMMDIDNFKSFNDTHGHDAGDLVLKELGVLLRDSLRAGDIACRYGGEEFLLALPGCDLRAAQTRLWQICSDIRRTTFVFRKHALPGVTMSVGLSQLDSDLSSAESIIAAADDALYKAKHGGRNRIESFSREMLASSGPDSEKPAAAELVVEKKLVN
jgi:diguanylate cyclase (GGDEF)-like protein